MDNQNETTSNVVFALHSDSIMLKAIAVVADKASRYQGKNFDSAYWIEFLLARGIKSYSDYLDADHERRSLAQYNESVARIEAPNPDKPESMIAYASEIVRLQMKFGIGGSKKTL